MWWCYLLVLLQYWKDAKSLYPYKGPLHHDSTLLMYIYYHIKCLLCMGKVKLQHYSIKNQMPWMVFTQKNYTPNQITKQRETYAAIVDELQELKNWLHKCYEAEVDAEIHEAEQCGGDIQKMSQPRVSEDLCPSNEALYIGTDKKGTRPNIQPASSEFDIGNSLACQRHRESESMERQKYALSQDEGTSLDMHIPSPQPIDKSKDAEPVPVKKKVISMQEYHARGQRQ